MRRILILASVALLSACGGGHTIISFQFGGVVTGTGCFSSVQESAAVYYAITLDEFAPGSSITLVDQAGTRWTGSMSTPSTANLTNANPGADPRMSISLSGFTSEGAHVNATSLCVSFRCCTTLSGDIRS